MCGIAGFVQLNREPLPLEAGAKRLSLMAGALRHRGPDDSGVFQERDGLLGLAHRRLSIVGIESGRQPFTNEDGSVVAICNGEFFDHEERRGVLEGRGHRFRSSSDSEILVHLWEEYGEDLFDRLRGQFAFALWDRNRRVLILARDRLGILPLFWTVTDRGTLLFGSEIKALLATGEVPAEPDHRGIDHVFTFMGMPAERTCFRGVKAISAGTLLKIDLGGSGRAVPGRRRYWDLDFPDQGDEWNPGRKKLLEGFEEVLHRATELRLRADVPVGAYLSGGVDSSAIVAVASRLRMEPADTFTIEIPSPRLNELPRARGTAEAVGSRQHVVTCGSDEICELYPDLVVAAEAPVMDTACAALMSLAGEVRRRGFKAVLTGEGADEALAGYPWFKTNRMLSLLDRGSFRPGNLLRYLAGNRGGPRRTWAECFRYQRVIGGPHAMADLCGLLAMAKNRFYSRKMAEQIGDHLPHEDLDLDLGRLRRWHPLNQSLYFGYKTMLPGLLMNQKGDRPAMHHSVETRYPFLDEDFVDFCAKVPPRWKLRGLLRDKHLLREFSSSLLPDDITRRRKHMFRAPFAGTFFAKPPRYVEQLLSPESLRATGYFDPVAVRGDLAKYSATRPESGPRMIVEMALTTVMATQLWHHLHIGDSLCELSAPSWKGRQATGLPVMPAFH